MAVLAGGYGAARFLQGLVQVHPASAVTAIVNCADDIELHGLYISPDLDTVTYGLAGDLDPETGWGLAGDTWHALEALRRLGGEAWFGLGDRDLATHLYRTQRRRAGAPLSTITAELAAARGVAVRILPVTDDRIETRVTLAGAGPESGREVGFQRYFVGLGHAVAVQSVRVEGAAGARPAPGVIEAIASAGTVVVAPSNPIVSIGPLLAIDAVRAAVEARREATVAISPIVAGAALRGPARRLLAELGHEPTVVGVARLYAPLAATLVIDVADADLAGAVEAEGMRCVVTPAIMHTLDHAAALATVTLEATGRQP